MVLSVRSLAAVGFVVAATVSGCGSEVTAGRATRESSSSSPSATTTSPGKAVDAEVAFAAVEKARAQISCTPLLAYAMQGAMTGTVPDMRDNAAKFRDLVTAWNTQLAGIEFPADAAPVVAELKEHTADEIKDLTAMTDAVDTATLQETTALLNAVNFDETSIRVELDDLSAVLGHPEPTSFVAGNLLELAYGTFPNDTTPVWPKFEAALKAGDLAGAKAANAIEQDAAQRYIDTLGKIAWPPGHEDQLTTLRDALRGVVEFDRTQVDVPTAADIVPPEQGAQVAAAAETAKGALMDSVMTEALKAGALPKC